MSQVPMEAVFKVQSTQLIEDSITHEVDSKDPEVVEIDHPTVAMEDLSVVSTRRKLSNNS